MLNARVRFTVLAFSGNFRGVDLSYALTIRAEQRVACFRFWDLVTIEEARQAFLEYVALPGFDPGYVMMSDASAVTSVEAGFIGVLLGVQGLAQQLKNFDRGALSVVLVKKDTVFGMVRMLEQVLDFASPIKLRIVWTPAEALLVAGRQDCDYAALFDF